MPVTGGRNGQQVKPVAGPLSRLVAEHSAGGERRRQKKLSKSPRRQKQAVQHQSPAGSYHSLHTAASSLILSRTGAEPSQDHYVRRSVHFPLRPAIDPVRNAMSHAV